VEDVLALQRLITTSVLDGRCSIHEVGVHFILAPAETYRYRIESGCPQLDLRPRQSLSAIRMPYKPARTSAFLTWLRGNLAFAISGAGAFLFVLVGAGYRAALQPFGVIPAEVGIDYATTVWGALPFILLICGPSSILFFIWPPRKQVEFASMSLQRYMVLYLIVTVPLALATTFEQSRYVRIVGAGRHYEPFLAALSPLALRADSVQIAWKQATANQAPLPSGRLLLLGVANGAAVVFEADTLRTWRIPVGDLIIIRNAFRAV
jgi:hypothetical protein